MFSKTISSAVISSVILLLSNTADATKNLRTFWGDGCGYQKQFMIAVKCGDGSTTLYCAPNNHQQNYCKIPDINWAKDRCELKDKFIGIDTSLTGCYSRSAEFWSNYASLSVEEDEDEFCESFPISVPSTTGVNLGFENGLNGWTISGPRSASVSAPCDGSAAEGSCYAKISTLGTNPSTAPNKISRDDLYVTSMGCNHNSYKLSFWYKFIAGDYLPYNDYMKVIVKDAGTSNVLSQSQLNVAQVGNFGNSGWLYATVDIGKPEEGTKLQVAISAETSNDRDGAFQSAAYLDGVSLYSA